MPATELDRSQTVLRHVCSRRRHQICTHAMKAGETVASNPPMSARVTISPVKSCAAAMHITHTPPAVSTGNLPEEKKNRPTHSRRR